jgi:hypothetical protein
MRALVAEYAETFKTLNRAWLALLEFVGVCLRGAFSNAELALLVLELFRAASHT